MGAGLRIQIRGAESAYPTLLDISAFLFDTNAAFELGFAAKNGTRVSPQHVWRRNGLRVPRAEQLHVARLRHESPIQVELLTVVSGAAVAGVFALAGIWWRHHLAKPKTAAEVRKLTAEAVAIEEKTAADKRAASAQLAALAEDHAMSLAMREAELDHYYRSVEKRLLSSKVQVEDLDFAVDAELPDDWREVTDPDLKRRR